MKIVHYLELFPVAQLRNIETLKKSSNLGTNMPDENLARAIRARVRRDMLHMLCQKEKISVHEMARRLDITESNSSKHLKLLYDLGLVNFEEKSPEKFYYLKINEIRELCKVYDNIIAKMRTA